MKFQPGQSGNPKGRKPEQQFRTALQLALGDSVKGGDPRIALRKIAQKLVTEAKKGEPWAIKELADRLDGKPAQAVTLSGDEDNPIRHEHAALDELTHRIDSVASRATAPRANGRGNGSASP